MIVCNILPHQNPYINLATEMWFLEKAHKNSSYIYVFFYENLSSIILGKTLELNEEVFYHKNTPPILRRFSGGGSVYHFRGNINYSIVLSLKEYPDFYLVDKSYQIILNQIIKSLSTNKFPLYVKGISDICLQINKSFYKISGNAQVRKKSWLLHHGTFIYNKQLPGFYQIPYYLQHPHKQPDYRKQRLHRDFLTQGLPIMSKEECMQKIMKQLKTYFQKDVLLNSYNFFDAFSKEIQNYISSFNP